MTVLVILIGVAMTTALPTRVAVYGIGLLATGLAPYTEPHRKP